MWNVDWMYQLTETVKLRKSWSQWSLCNLWNTQFLFLMSNINITKAISSKNLYTHKHGYQTSKCFGTAVGVVGLYTPVVANRWMATVVVLSQSRNWKIYVLFGTFYFPRFHQFLRIFRALLFSSSSSTRDAHLILPTSVILSLCSYCTNVRPSTSNRFKAIDWFF